MINTNRLSLYFFSESYSDGELLYADCELAKIADNESEPPEIREAARAELTRRRELEKKH